MLINEFRMSYVTPFYPGSALFPLLTARKSSCVVMFWQDFVVIFKDDAISSILSVSQVSKSSRVLCGREVREDAFAHSLICSFASSSGCGWLVRFFVLSLTIFTRYHISLRLLHSTMFCADSYQYFSNTSFRFLHISLISLAFLVPLTVSILKVPQALQHLFCLASCLFSCVSADVSKHLSIVLNKSSLNLSNVLVYTVYTNSIL